MIRSPRPLRVLLFATCLLALPALAAHATVLTNYVLQWGTTGTGNGQFNAPAGVAVDYNSNVYVTDMGNDRVQVFNSSGVWQYGFGGTGSGPGQFRRPYGIAINGGDLYVVDTGNYRVQKFTLAGSFVLQWGTQGSGAGQFRRPRCAAADGVGNVFVTDDSLDRVQKFDGLGSYLMQWGSTGNAPGDFRGPIGIAADGGGGAIFVADSANCRIQRFDNGGNLLNLWGTQGNGNGQLQGPVGIASSGFEFFGVDTGNDRCQKFDYSYQYATQWGGTGAANGQFVRPHAAAIDGVYIYVVDTGNDRVQKFGPPSDGACAACFSPPGACCAGLPQIGGPWTNIAVGTRVSDPSGPWPYAVTIFNLNALPLPADDVNWASMTRYTGPGAGWRTDSLGSVFGLTLDPYGNIFVAHSSCYGLDKIGQVFGGAPGAIYRIDAVSGAIKTFCVLPNLQDPMIGAGDNWPGLGNLSYDCQHQQMFATDLEDGRIYRIKANGVNGTTGSVVDTFDPLAPDDGLPGWAPIGERLWGIQVHGNRVYYAVWALDQTSGSTLNEIRSVGLTPAGAFTAGSDQHEIWLPVVPAYDYSFPVADISFSPAGRMLLGERGIYTLTNPLPHYARALEYQCSGGCWIPGNTYLLGVSNGFNAEGGVDYDAHPFNGPSGAIGRVWATSDAIHIIGTNGYTDDVYGYQGMRPNLPLGTSLTSKLIDSDGPTVSFLDKSNIGDIEVPGCPTVETGAICGQKFIDANRNGVKDPGESVAAGWTIRATGPGGTSTTVTDANGNYCFTNLLGGTWTVSEVGQPSYIQTAPTGGTYNVSLAGGQTLFGYDFGNYACAPGGPGCVQPPTGMVAWYPFAPATGTTTTADVTHLTPARNVAQLVGGAVIEPGGAGGSGGLASFGGLRLATAADYARVPYANQLDLNFGVGSFSIDAWVNPDAGVHGQRTIVEKRQLNSTSPYRILGWALYLEDRRLTLEIGNGLDTQVVPGPVIPAGDWSHVAVTVDRGTPAGVGRWYVNGTPVAAADFVPLTGKVSNGADLYIGQANPTFGARPGLGGTIVHLELFKTVLPGGSVQTISAAYVAGKCPEFIALPAVTSICNNANTVLVCFNICNATATPQSYHWSAAGLPAGPGCAIVGPTQFSPPAGSVTVPPGGCSPPICMTIARPAGLSAQNATACYAVSIVNDATGVCYTKQGTIRADITCWCVTPTQTGLVSVLARVAAGTAIGIGVGYPCDPVTTMSYRVSAVWLDTDHPDPQALRLNGLPPGEPVLGTLSVDATGTAQLEVHASYPDGYDPAAPYEIVFEGDTDGDGNMEQLSGTIVTAAYDSTVTLAVPGRPSAPSTVRLVTAPNPFIGTTSVAFSLARADDVDLGIYDLSGRLVRVLQRGRLAAGAHTFAWNGRDDRGHRAAAGVYFVRMDAAERVMEAKIVKVE